MKINEFLEFESLTDPRSIVYKKILHLEKFCAFYFVNLAARTVVCAIYFGKKWQQ